MKIHIILNEEICSYDDTDKGMRQALDRVVEIEEDGYDCFIIRGELDTYVPQVYIHPIKQPQDKGSIIF